MGYDYPSEIQPRVSNILASQDMPVLRASRHLKICAMESFGEGLLSPLLHETIFSQPSFENGRGTAVTLVYFSPTGHVVFLPLQAPKLSILPRKFHRVYRIYWC